MTTPADAPSVSATDRELLVTTYRAFNAREIETVLAVLHPDVKWANGMDGGFVHGRDAVREYWTRQWRMIDPHVEPQAFAPEPDGVVVVTVYQVVHDLAGTLLLDQTVWHVYQIENGLVKSMEIRRE